MPQGFLYSIFRNLVKSNAVGFLRIRIQGRDQMPGDRFALPVRVSRKENLVGFLYFLSERCQDLSLAADCNIFRFVIIRRVKTELALGKIPHMTRGSHNHIAGAKEFTDRFDLGR